MPYATPGSGHLFTSQLKLSPLPVCKVLSGHTKLLAGPQIGFAFLYSALLPMSYQMKWPSLPLYPFGEFLSSFTLSSNFTASQEHSVTFRGRMCSNSTLLFRGNEIELEGTHLQPDKQAVTPLCCPTSSKSWGWRCYLAKLVGHLGAYLLTLESLGALL